VAEARLPALALAAFRHDLLRLPKDGSSDESAQERMHPSEPARLFEHTAALEKAVPADLSELYPVETSESEGEWVQKRRAPHQGAHLIGLCDMYEHMSHPRPWREGMLPHEALVVLLKQHRRESDQRLLKVFAERLCLYPPGSFVELSTGEFGRVAAASTASPTRPLVEVLIRPDGAAARPSFAVDLARLQHLHILRAVDETRLPIKDLRLRLWVRAARWWL
jgi:hypothetical protein